MEEAGLVFRGCQLPPGFRFQPTDQEMIVFYLKKKIAGTDTSVTSIIADVDIYKFDPWELPGKAISFSLAGKGEGEGDGEWFFFSPRDRKYPNGCRPNRRAGSGYWKATGADKPIVVGSAPQCLVVGVKKELVFYQGRSPQGSKTEWVMQEYRLLDVKQDSMSMRLDDWVLCRLRKKHGQQGQGVVVNYDHHHFSNREEVVVPLNNNNNTAAASSSGPAGGGGGPFAGDWNDDPHLLQYLTAAGHDMEAELCLLHFQPPPSKRANRR